MLLQAAKLLLLLLVITFAPAIVVAGLFIWLGLILWDKQGWVSVVALLLSLVIVIWTKSAVFGIALFILYLLARLVQRR